MDMTEEEKMRKAREHVEALTGLYIHLAVYVLVNALLIGINWATSPEEWWAQWPLLGWGAGVFAHALLVYVPLQGTLSRWQARKIQEVRSRMP